MQQKNTTDYGQASRRIIDLLFDGENRRTDEPAEDIFDLTVSLEEWTQVFWHSRRVLEIAIPLMLERADQSVVTKCIAAALLDYESVTNTRGKRTRGGKLRLVRLCKEPSADTCG